MQRAHLLSITPTEPPPPYLASSPIYLQVKSLVQSGISGQLGRIVDGKICGDHCPDNPLASNHNTPRFMLKQQHSLFVEVVMDTMSFTRVSRSHRRMLQQQNSMGDLVIDMCFNSVRGRTEAYFCGTKRSAMSLKTALILMKINIHNLGKGENVQENIPFLLTHNHTSTIYPADGVITTQRQAVEQEVWV